MFAVLWNLASFVVAIAILIAVHEWGHFWVARRCGVKVERFSLGFGKVLWSFKDRHDTEFSLSLIPLGGYVKMLDERQDEVPEALRDQAFNNKRVWQRFAIVAAGPAANFVFALFAFWLMFMMGVPSVKPIIGEVSPNSSAAHAGLVAGMEILAVDGQSTKDWEAVSYALVGKIGEKQTTLQVQGDNGKQDKLLSLEGWRLSSDDEGLPFAALGLSPLQPEITLEIADVLAGGSGARAGIQPGDQIVTVSGKPLNKWQEFVSMVQSSPENPLALEVERKGSRVAITLTPDKKAHGAKSIGYVGLAPKVLPLDERYRIELRYDPLQAMGMALQKSATTVELTVNMLGKLISGVVSIDNLSGPISIAKGAGSTASYGLVYFLGFLALVSINLGIINLFPLPILDGGHLLFLMLEGIRGKPIPEQVQEYAFKFGAAVLICLMAIALFNDFARL
jgi:regulator of sigma E protease